MSITLFLKCENNRIARFWAVFCIAVAIWGIGGFLVGIERNADRALIFWRFSYVGVIATPVMFYHFVQRFTGQLKGWWIKLHYAISLIFEVANWTELMEKELTHLDFNTFYPTKVGWLFPIFVLYFIVMVVAAHYDLWKHYTKSNSVQIRNQVLLFFAGTAIGFAGGVTCFFPCFGWGGYPWGNFAVVLYPLIMGYAILKHKLLDIDFIIKKTFYYSLLTLTLSVVYALIAVMIQLIGTGEIALSAGFWHSILMLIYRWSGAVTFISMSGLALLVINQGSKSALNRKFLIAIMAIGLWAAGSWTVNIIPDPDLALIVLKTHYAFGVWVPALFLSVALEIIEKQLVWFRRFCFLISMVYTALLPSRLFLVGLREVSGSGGYRISDPGVMYLGFIIYFVAVMAIGLFLLIHHAAKRQPHTLRASYATISFLVGAIAGSEYFMCVYGRISRPPVDDFLLVVMVVILAYAVLKKSLLNLAFVARKTMYYSALTFFISVIYTAIMFGMHRYVSGGTPAPYYMVTSIVLMLTITLGLRPLESFLRETLDRKFFKGTIEQIAEQKALLEFELERTERLKSVGILAAGMAHEIKNPITAIRTFAEYLPEKYDDPEFRKTFSRLMQTETERISQIVQDLLFFAKPSEPKIERCDIREVVEGICQLLSQDFIRHNIQCHVAIPDLARYVMADTSQMKQAVLNIVMNAVDAMKLVGKRELAITSRNAGEKIELSIRDTGIGIPPEKLPHIFDPFFTGKDQGNGLGLAITHSIIQRNCGSIRVESVVGEGTVFHLSLRAIS